MPGPSRAQAWRAGAPLEGAIWVETIPFNETRDYVKKVLANTMFYARELNQPYVPLTARLGTIPPRDDASGATVAARSSVNATDDGRDIRSSSLGGIRLRRPPPVPPARRPPGTASSW